MTGRAKLASVIVLVSVVSSLSCAAANQTDPAPTPGRLREEISDPFALTPDCNRNGIADTTDVLTGVAEDLNHNGEVDYCDPDSTAIALVMRNWVRMADRADSSYLGMWYQRREFILVKYTVPRGMHRVTIRVIDRESGKESRLKDTLERQGAYRLKWFPVKEDGSSQLRGTYDLHATIASQTYHKPVAWDWRTYHEAQEDD